MEYKTAKDLYIELMVMGWAPNDIDDELLLALLEEQRESAEQAAQEVGKDDR